MRRLAFAVVNRWAALALAFTCMAGFAANASAHPSRTGLVGLFEALSGRFYLTHTARGTALAEETLGRRIATRHDYELFLQRVRSRRFAETESAALTDDLDRLRNQAEVVAAEHPALRVPQVMRRASERIGLRLVDGGAHGRVEFVSLSSGRSRGFAASREGFLQADSRARGEVMLPYQPALAPMAAESEALLQAVRTEATVSIEALAPYPRSLARAYEFIDLHDLLAAMARGHAEPWKLYDGAWTRPLLDKWLEATGSALQDRSITGIYRTLAENPSGRFRGTPIVAGGPTELGGKTYYRITPAQREVLERNPYLTIEVRADPWSPDGTTLLARHEYPSARTFRRFESSLSPELRQRLQAAEAEGAFARPESERMQDLTREVLTELTRGVPGEPLAEYQQLISIHPFDDFNGRTMRAWYQRRTGEPMFMRNWDMDLFLSPEGLSAEVRAGKHRLERIIAGMDRASRDHGGFPRFFDQPEPWMMAAGIHESPRDGLAFARRAQDWFRDPYNADLVRKKLDFEIHRGLRDHLAGETSSH